MTKFVFGAGIALVNHWELIKKYENPIGCIDNDSSKWGQRLRIGLPCLSIEEAMKYECPEVLITVGDPYVIEVIKKQLEEKRVPYTVLIDKLKEWGREEEFPKHLEMIKKDEKRKLLLMNTPEHDNVGDHLIALSEMEFLQSRFPKYSIYEITDIEFLWHRSKLKQYIHEEDIIFITGGGFLGSLWLYNGETNVREILQEYRDNRIIILPQTIYFENNERGKKEYHNSLEAYNQAKKLTLLLRDRKSYELVEHIEDTSFRFEIMPDMAFFYQKNMKIELQNKKEKIVLFCIRKDKESVLPAKLVEQIKEVFREKGYRIAYTSMHSGKFEGLDGREEQVRCKLQEIANVKVVVTDTLHCMVSSALMGTPCFAFDNVSGKVRNVYHWIENLPYIYMQQSISDIEKIVARDNFQKGEFYLDKSEMYLDRLERLIRDEG